MNAGLSGGQVADERGGNFSRSRKRKPSLGGRIGGYGASAGKPARSVLTDSPLELAASPRCPWCGAEPLEGIKRCGQVDPCVGGGLHPAEPLAEDELDPGAVERPAVGAGHGERSFE
jgi:hypothetical protein